MSDTQDCPNCNATVPSRFCSECGTLVKPLTLEEQTAKLLALESRLKDQTVVDVETSQMIANRLLRWAKIWGWLVGSLMTLLGLIIPLAVTLYTTHQAASVRDLVSQTRSIVEPILDATRKEVKAAKDSADATSAEAKTISNSVQMLQQNLARASNSVSQLSQTVATVQSQNLANTVLSVYPGLFGTLVVEDRKGHIINIKSKPPKTTYVAFGILMPNSTPTLAFTEQQLISVMDILQEKGFTTFVGGLTLVSVGANGSSRGIDALAEGGCEYYGHLPKQVPCILYFTPQLRESASSIQQIVKPLQVVPDGMITYVDPKKLSENQRALISDSGADVLVVVGSAS